MPDSSYAFNAHYTQVIKALTDGRLIPFLGAGVNLCGRPKELMWNRKQAVYLPSGGELAADLAENFGYPLSKPQVECPLCSSRVDIVKRPRVQCPCCKTMGYLVEKPLDLLRVSQYIAVKTGSGPLYEDLRLIFDANYPPTPLHQFFATLPSTLRRINYPRPPCYQLIMTTNYDDVLERAFQAVRFCENHTCNRRDVPLNSCDMVANGDCPSCHQPLASEQVDVVSYVAVGEQQGKFVHRLPNGKERLIEKPNEDADLPLDQHTVILKIHGAVNRKHPDQDSFVITEDDYIAYLAGPDISRLVPTTILAKMRQRNFLFMGYSLSDWNLRVILRRIWQERKHTYKSWAIQLSPDPIDQEFWRDRGVEILPVRLEDYVAALGDRLKAL